jgi:hypothetical protein
MNTQSNLNSSELKRGSLLFWLALLVPVAIIPLGINFFLNPVGATAAFGVPITDPSAFPFMHTKGIRDIFSGLVMLPFFMRGERRTVAIIFAIATLIPIGDGWIILNHLGFVAPIFIHWGTALYMMIIAAFLLKNPGERG